MLDPGVSPGTRPATDSRQQRAVKHSVVDAVRSMAVVIGVVVVLVLVLPRPNSTPLHSVDVVSVAQGAAITLGFTPAVPRVPQGWVATSAGVRNSADGVTTWHIGYLTSNGHYASIEQAAKVTSRWEEILNSGGTLREPQTIDGTTWEQRFKDVRDVYSLIRRGESRTTMVTSKGGGLAQAVILARSIPVTLR
jgi:hypothetical protein